MFNGFNARGNGLNEFNACGNGFNGFGNGLNGFNACRSPPSVNLLNLSLICLICREFA